MKKYVVFLATIFCLSVFTPLLYAQTTQLITLKDGSTLKGKVVELKNGFYTIQTSSLGEINIPDADILSIVNNSSVASTHQNNQQLPAILPTDPEFKEYMQQLQETFLSDPNLIMDIQGLVQDEEIMSILTDQNFIDDILSYDLNKIENNEKTDALMQNQKMQDIIEKINKNIILQKPLK